MPELPEVECIVRSLRPHLQGRRLLRVEFRSKFVASAPARRWLGRFEGGCVRELARRGKFILMQFDAGFCAIHLRMTGRLVWNASGGPYTRAAFHLDAGLLLLDDVRQFARILAGPRLPEAVLALGPEPFALTSAEFAARLHMRRTRIKPLLLDQRFLAGLGNIYADEALHRARIHPLTPANRLSQARAHALHQAIMSVLEEAIAAGGSSVSDYVDGEGRTGAFQLFHRVYGRAGLPCPACATPVARITAAGRGTHFCPRCQRAQ